MALALFVFSMTLIPKLGGDFLPEFNEGSFTINVALAPGTSLDESNRISILAEKLIHEIPEVLHTARRTGRAENDEHALGVNTTELEVSLNLKNDENKETNDEANEFEEALKSKAKVQNKEIKSSGSLQESILKKIEE